MKKIFLRGVPIAIAIMIAGCGGSYYDTGELVGVPNRPGWSYLYPYGMSYIPSGTLNIGQSDQDINYSFTQRAKSISIQGFYMDDTEITNNEYRQFVYWVKDSLSAYLVGDPYIIEDEDGNETIDWILFREQFNYADPEIMDMIEELYVAEDQQFWGQKEFNTGKLVFTYDEINYREASKLSSRSKERSTFIMNRSMHIYPDTLCWVRDYTYSYNEPMTRRYFSHPAFDKYPVVGVNWLQATAFCAWRSKLWLDYRRA